MQCLARARFTVAPPVSALVVSDAGAERAPSEQLTGLINICFASVRELRLDHLAGSFRQLRQSERTCFRCLLFWSELVYQLNVCYVLPVLTQVIGGSPVELVTKAAGVVLKSFSTCARLIKTCVFRCACGGSPFELTLAFAWR